MCCCHCCKDQADKEISCCRATGVHNLVYWSNAWGWDLLFSIQLWLHLHLSDLSANPKAHWNSKYKYVYFTIDMSQRCFEYLGFFKTTTVVEWIFYFWCNEGEGLFIGILSRLDFWTTINSALWLDGCASWWKPVFGHIWQHVQTSFQFSLCSTVDLSFWHRGDGRQNST
jgi:hypothetical protein